MTIKNGTIENMLNSNETEFIVWDEKLTTGIEMIDDQHKELVSLTNHLYKACLSGDRATAVFQEAMTAMVDYVRFHFSAEQQLLAGISYPDYPDHKKQHESLIRDILGAAKDFKEGRQFIPNQFVRTLKEWILGHIAVYDRNYAGYVMSQKKKGLLNDIQISSFLI